MEWTGSFSFFPLMLTKPETVNISDFSLEKDGFIKLANLNLNTTTNLVLSPASSSTPQFLTTGP
jgi:hypothetical protein